MTDQVFKHGSGPGFPFPFPVPRCLCCAAQTWLYILPICHSCLFSPERAVCHPAKTALQKETKKTLPHPPDSERKTPMKKLQVSKKHWHPSSEKKKKKIMQVLGFPLSRVLKSPFVICSKMAAVGNRKHLFVVVWFASPCSNMFTAQGPADRKNIWLLCTAERVHIYYT